MTDLQNAVATPEVKRLVNLVRKFSWADNQMAGMTRDRVFEALRSLGIEPNEL